MPRPCGPRPSGGAAKLLSEIDLGIFVLVFSQLLQNFTVLGTIALVKLLFTKKILGLYT